MNQQPPGLGERLLEVGQGLLLLAVPAAGAWLIRSIRESKRRREAQAKLEAAGYEALRTLDQVRQYLHERAWDGERAEVLILRREVDESREALWTATGHASKRQELTEDDVVRIIKRTHPDARKPFREDED